MAGLTESVDVIIEYSELEDDPEIEEKTEKVKNEIIELAEALEERENRS